MPLLLRLEPSWAASFGSLYGQLIHVCILFTRERSCRWRHAYALVLRVHGVGGLCLIYTKLASCLAVYFSSCNFQASSASKLMLAAN